MVTLSVRVPNYGCSTSTSLSLVAIILVSSYLIGYGAAVQFSFSPSPNITANGDPALYQCSVSDFSGDVRVVWSINTTTLPHDNYTDLTITGGDTFSTLSIPALLQYNNSVVECRGIGVLDGGDLYDQKRNSTLRMQGLYGVVGDLSCSLQYHCIQCDWSPPFSIVDVTDPNVTNYVVDITDGSGPPLTSMTLVFPNHTTYCPSYYGNYMVSVAANNTAGVGNVSTVDVHFPPVYIPVANLTNHTNGAGEWNITFTIPDTSSLDHNSNYRVYANLNEGEVVRSGSGRFEGDKFKGTVSMGQLPRWKWRLTIDLQYPSSDLFINSSQPTDISTFDVQNGHVTVINETEGHVCFTATFAEGSTLMECLVTYFCRVTSYSGNVTINRNFNTTSCTSGINTNNYTVTFHDGNNTDSAAVLLHKVINGVPLPSSTEVTSVSSTSNILVTSSSSPTPSVLLTDTTSSGSNVGIIIGPIAAGIFIIVIVILSVFIVGYITMCTYKKKPRKDLEDNKITTTVIVDGATAKPNYTDVGDFSTCGPQAPLSTGSTVPYSEVRHEDLPLGTYMYEKATVPSPSLPHSSDDTLYHRLDHSKEVCSHRQPEEEPYDIPKHENRTITIPPPAADAYSTLPSNAHTVTGAFNNSNYSTLAKPDERLSSSNKKELTHTDLTTLVAPHLSTKWYEMGQALAITPDVLDEMEENRQGISDVFIQWQEGKTRPFTWDTLITILKSTTVNEPQLAEQLESELKN